MIPALSTAAASSDDYLLALAQGLSGLLGITTAVLIFVIERQVHQFRVHDRAYAMNLIVLIVVSTFTILLAGLTWWAWASTAPTIDLLFCWSPQVWLALLFGGVVLSATASLLFGLIALILQWRKGLSGNWDP